jgi:hypothetical protein
MPMPLRRRLSSGEQLNGKRKRKKSIIIPGDGDPCPRCGEPMQIREYEKQAHQPPFYTRWFCRMNNACNTKLVMHPRFKMA